VDTYVDVSRYIQFNPICALIRPPRMSCGLLNQEAYTHEIDEVRVSAGWRTNSTVRAGYLRSRGFSGGLSKGKSCD
jgi:hypothetical protein